MSMRCDQTIYLLDALIDEELDAVTVLSVTEHASACPACAAEYERRRTVQRLTRQALQPAGVSERWRRELEASVRALDRPRLVATGPFRFLRLAIPALALLLAPWLILKSPWGESESREKYVYHVNQPENAAAMLQNIEFHLRAAPKARFVVVAHNGGVDFLLKGATDAAGRPLASRVAQLANQGVEFRVCKNTLAIRRIAESDIIAQASFVPSGIAEVGRLQTKEGYAYLKP